MSSTPAPQGPTLHSRRRALQTLACGFGGLALAGLWSARGAAGAGSAGGPGRLRVPHFPPRARRVIFLFMQGGPSQVDTFDYKPLLERHDGSQMPFDDPRTIANTGQRATDQRVMKSPWAFRQYGASGRWVSELFPEVARHVDDLCFIHSMRTEGVAHGPATLFLHCGATQFIRPSMGAWINYGLGTENENLPGFVTIAPSLGNGGPRNFGPAFLPAACQGTPIGTAGQPAAELGLRNLGGGGTPAARRRQLDLLQALHAERAAARPGDAALEAIVQSYELAWRMQSEAPGVLDLRGESPATLALYGIGDRATDDFGRQCLMARRLCESGVRFVQVTYGDNTANPRWDQHSNLPKHADHARAVDRPIAGLLADLKARGLLEDTLVWWGGEFGRTPYAQKNGTGRDHNPAGFTVWLAGAGVRPGFALGRTDDFGARAVEDQVHMHDLHATILHLLGLNHEQLTFRHDGRDHRLTDVHGRIIRSLLA
ncbi:MAG: hypothetical protein RJA22_3269 [Verrucomicrobiota bacterium]